nr:MAG TPA: hypothetical protein [Caudoviricetes sp.]
MLSMLRLITSYSLTISHSPSPHTELLFVLGSVHILLVAQ